MTNDSTSPEPSQWMYREIHEQPETVSATLDRYLEADAFRDDTCAPIRAWLRAVEHEIVIVASGSSRHAAMVAELQFEQLAAVPVDVEYASEYTSRPEKTLKRASVIVVSQSGETADTLAALRKANAAGRRTLALTNSPDSTMAREAAVAVPVMAGRERAIPATKSFTGQLLTLYLIALLAGQARGVISQDEIVLRLDELQRLPSRIRQQLPGWTAAMPEIVGGFGEARSFLFLGRGVHYPIAREGALKLKESAYLHAEGYPSGELKHGPNALVSVDTPLVMLATVDHEDAASVERYEKTMQLMRDMREQGATILALTNRGDGEAAALATSTLFVEAQSEDLLPVAEVIPLQLLAFFMATARGIEVDRPRNLSKAVLVE
jgi:glucosamine--fructose-6-phosphate aminotransferase (isomerizing)